MPDPVISPERKSLYYVGMGLVVLGFVLFLSTFFTAVAHFGDFTDFEARARSSGFRALSGMVLIAVGGILTGIGRAGMAGSGFKLDPTQMREDLKPWNQAAGGMLQDRLSEVGIVNALEKHLDDDDDDSERQPHVKIRCRQCQTLNDEDAKFCKQCGTAV